MIWKFLLISLPIDLMVVSLDLRVTFSPQLLGFLELAAILGLITSAAFLLRDSIIDSLDSLESIQQRAMRFTIKHSDIIFLVVAALTTLEIIFHAGVFGAIALIPGIIIAVRASRAIKKSLGEHTERFLALERDQVLLLNVLNKRLLTLSLVPIAAARAASFCAALGVLATTRDVSNWLPYGVAALVLLLTFLPQEEDFLIRCQKCSRWTSRALKSRGYCPVCSREEFQVKDGTDRKDENSQKERKSYAARLKDLKKRLRRETTSEIEGASAPTAPPSASTATGRSKSYEIAKGLSAKFFPRINKD